ncbi:hypothetical protein C0995_006260 [Termitomyces sp. Mi166|nr:hypothetical protein C0995_006260 [Termitomyces sp. Mi166\
MASTVEQRDGAVEHEMSTHQRGLVDTCLEEGQFESAIALLEQLRSPSYKPTISHIRQLIYIALQPEHPPSIHEIVIADVPSSPSKATLKKRIPSGTAVLAARRLLNSFAITNSPESIAAALPFYDDPRKNESVTQADDGLLESVIGPQSMCISRAKNCWSILAQGYTQRGQTFSVSSDNGKKRSYNLDENDSMNNFENAIVGDDAWSTLDWLILLFEQDEMLADSRGSGRFSSLLLQQIPPPRSGTGPRWDTEIPMRIIFFCMEQTDFRRQMLGSRLMTLLINLSATRHLDLSMFVGSLYSHLTAAGLEKLPALLSNLYPSTPAHRFKIMLCRKLLSDASRDQMRDVRTRVQARARALRATRTEEIINSQSPETSASAQTTRSPVLSYIEIIRCLEASASSSSMAVTQSILLRVKFELINSYGMLQSEMAPAERDSDWTSILQDGKANQLIDTMFNGKSNNPDSRVFREVLQSTVPIWSS